MPILTNIRHERFAQGLAQGKTADEAYRDAGFKPSRANASTLKSKQNILDRMSELQSRASTGLVVTLQWLMEKAEEARALAMTSGQVSAAVAAIKEIGVLSGKRIERAETGNPGDFDRMSDDELARYVADESARVGKGLH